MLHPLFSQKIPYGSEGFVAKLDSNLNPLFATYLGAQTAQSVSRIALDSSGNAYVAGSTQDPNFPVTGPVLGTGAPGPSNNTTTPLTYGFVSKISAGGSQLLYSRLIGADQTAPCPSPMGCNEPAGTTIPYALVLDSSGALTIAGSTNAMNFPITPGVYQNTCNCPWPSSSNFVSRVAPDGSKLAWSTYMIPAGNSNAAGAQFLSEDAAGNVYIAGSSVLQIVNFNGSLQTSSSVADAFVAKLNAEGTALFFETDWNGINGAVLSGMALDPSGNLWLAGNTKAPNFPWLANVPATGVDFALELNSTGSAPRRIQELLPGTVNRPIAFDAGGNLLLLSSKGSLLRLNPANADSAPALFA
ncbi:MAG: SBBP repeat-containing protein, partial [Bryobacteraceae bacterium]